MKRVNLYLLNMSREDNTSGVDRYINILIEGLRFCENINLCFINFIEGESFLFPRKEYKKEYYHYCEIPLPVTIREILLEPYWMSKYSEQVFRQIHNLFHSNELNIIHLHTINLIDFALFLKKRLPCYIITHLHCIPWKQYYNTDRKRFNRVYKEVYIEKKNVSQILGTIGLQCEYRAYKYSDHIICVTECARLFLLGLLPKLNKERISVIYNGLYDAVGESKMNRPKDKFRFFYVGAFIESKGLKFILKSLRILKSKGLLPTLVAAGKYTDEQYRQIMEEYSDLDIELKGLLCYSELQKEYTKCNAGIIASLQEQCSYAAIEMMMHGLPIVTTDVDGLHEMFDDHINALKIPVSFSLTRGLEVDTNRLAEAMYEIMTNSKLRKLISKGARNNFKQKFSASRMLEETIKVYETIV